MNCPWCGKEMEKGAVMTDQGIGLYFFPEGEEPNWEINTRKNVEKKGGIILDGPYWISRWEFTSAAASVCRDCRKIVIDYGEWESSP